jgi:hypothetical protein
VMRWQIETTFQEARRHLGVETQKAVVGAGNPANHTGAVGTVLIRNPLGPPANDAERGGRLTGGVVSQNPPDLL